MKICAFALVAACLLQNALALDIALPTSNDALLKGKPEEFYMYVNRWLDGVQTTAWEGGQYGFVRDPRRTSTGLIFTRFHDGIDIRPMQRDAQGNPLDTIHSIAAGRVVHTSPDRRASNFGSYLVVEHQWDGCPYFSLYAHLSEIYVAPGTQVAKGEKLALMGFTGRGIDRERAHLHLEVTLLLNENFDAFSCATMGGGSNRHGNFNGINLRGINVARLFLEAHANPKLTIPEFLAREPVFFHVDVPGNQTVDLLRRYPWLSSDATAAASPPGSWRISFSQSGTPLRVSRIPATVPAPLVRLEQASEHPLHQLTCRLLSGSMSAPVLTSYGKQLLSLLTFDSATTLLPAAPATAQSASLGAKSHVVKKGETLITIGKVYGVEAEQLRAANGLTDSKLLKVGQKLTIPVANSRAIDTGALSSGG